MNHAAQASLPARFERHGDEGIDFPLQIPRPISRIPPVLAPLARKDTPLRRLGRDSADATRAEQRQTRRLVHPRPLAVTRGEDQVQHRRADDADDGPPAHGERNAHAEHGEAVREVDRAVERVDDPRRHVVAHEVLVARQRAL